MGRSVVPESRRKFLRWALLSAIGLAIPLAAERLAKADFTMNLPANGGSTLATVFAVSNAKPTFLRAKIAYFQMAQYLDVSEEYFYVQSPALVQDLLNAVLMRHPSMPPEMMSSMLVLLNGSPAKATASLKDGDEVDLIPLVSGG